MRDYAELAKALRCCHLTSGSGCAECPRRLENNDSCYKLLPDAADAIEELLAAVSKWISVEERLPSRYETVLLHIRTYKDSYVTIGDYEPNELRFRDFGDRNNQVYCGDVVTHWASLPEAPREEI